MIVVVATTENEVADIQAHLGALATTVVAPSATRRLVLVAVEDEREASRLAAVLRSDGMVAVTRPDGGPRLEAWIRDTRPVTFGEGLSVCHAYSEHERGDLSGLIELRPGGFGNGRHPTTRLLAEELLARIAGGERVLDFGCGSGVLGLCALQLGAAHVVAVDLKPEAIEASRINAALNGMDEQWEATLAPLGEIEGVFDVIVANVARGPVVALASEFVRRLAPGGWLAVSGISPSQCSLVAGFLLPLVEVGRRTAGEWSSLVMAHPVAS